MEKAEPKKSLASLATIAYTFIALVVTYPLALNFRSFVIGDLEGDMWKHLWGFWWVKESLVDNLKLPLETRLLNYPYGGSLFFIDPLGGLLATPLQLVFSVEVVYNLLIIFNLVLAAVGAFHLARYLTKSPHAAFVAGVTFGFCPFLMAYITSGVTEALNVGWIPLFMLYFIRSLREHSLRNPLYGGVFFFLATMGCWYYGTFCILFAFFYFLYLIVSTYWEPVKARLAQTSSATAAATKGREALARYGPPALLAVSAVAFLRALPGLIPGKAPFPGAALLGSCAWFLGMVIALYLMKRRTPAQAKHPGIKPGDVIAALYHILVPVAIIVFSAVSLSRILPTLLTGSAAMSPAVTVTASLINVVGIIVAAIYLVKWERERILSLVALVKNNFLNLLILASIGLSFFVLSSDIQNLAQGKPVNPLMAVISYAALLGYILYLSSLIVKRTPPGEENIFTRGFRFYREHLRRNLLWFLLVAVLTMPVIYYANPLLTQAGFIIVWSISVLFFWSSILAFIFIRRRVRGLQARAEETGESRGYTLYQVALQFYHRHVMRPLILFFLGGVLVLPVAAAFRQTLNRETSLVYRVREEKSIDIYLSKRFHNISKMSDYFVPGKHTATRTYTVDKLTRVSYCGWVSFFLAAAGLLLYRRRDQRFWLAGFVLFMLLSMGPFLYITENTHLESRFFLYMLLYRFFPFFSQVSIPYRFNILAMLCLAMGAAYFLSCYLRRRRPWEKTFLTAIVSLSILLEVLIVSPAPYPIPLSSTKVPAYCRTLGKDPGEYGVIDIPIQRYKGELLPGEYFFYQMYHRKGIPNKVEGTIPVYVFKNPLTVYLFNIEHSYTGYLSERKENLAAGIDELKRFRVKYFIVHDNYLRSGAKERIHKLLAFFFGKPVIREGDIFIYQVYREKGKRK